MEEYGDKELKPQHVADVEQLLGAEILPEHVPYPQQPDGIREIAYRAVLRMIATERYIDRQAAQSHENYDPQVWSGKWHMRGRHYKTIRNKHQQSLHLLADHLTIANDVAAYHQDPETHSAMSTARDRFQELAKLHMWNYVEYPGISKVRQTDPTAYDALRGAALAVVAPVGSGKTRLQAWCLKAMKIGEPVHGDEPRQRRALIVLSSQAMVDQYMADEPDNDFREIIGRNVSTGAVWEFSKHSNAAVTFVIAQSLPKLVQDKLIKPEDYHVTIVDEGHISLAGKILDNVSKLGSRLLFFTATPAKNEVRDLREHFSHVEEGDMRSFVQEGILNPVRLMTFQYSDVVELAGKLAVRVIESGRKIAIYCKARNPSEDESQAQAIQDYINANLTLPQEGYLDGQAAHVLGSINGKARNDAVLRHLKAGTVRAVQTVNMIAEGFNDPDLDTVMLIDQTSSSEVIQRSGRCMRTKEGKPESWVFELFPQEQQRVQDYYSIWQAYGFDYIKQALHFIKVGDDDLRQELLAIQQTQELIQGWEPGIRPPDLPPSRGHYSQNKTVVSHWTNQSQDNADVQYPEVVIPHMTTEEFEARRKALGDLDRANAGWIVEDQPVRSTIISREKAERERFLKTAIPSEDLAAEYELPHLWLEYFLDNNRVPYEAVQDDEFFKRQYAAEARLAIESGIRSRYSGRFSVKDVLRIYKISEEGLQQIYPDASVHYSPRIVKYSLADLVEIEKNFGSFEVATDDDVPLTTVRAKFRAQGKHDSFIDHYLAQQATIVTNKRRQTIEGLTPPWPHVTHPQMAAIIANYNGRPVATDEHISLAEIAQLADVTKQTIIGNLTVAERKKIEPMIARAKQGKPGHYLPREAGLDIAERLKRHKLPHDLVPMSIVASRINAKKARIADFYKYDKDMLKLLNIGLIGGPTTCITWAMLEELEVKFGLQPNQETIDYRLLATANTESKKYAQSIQAKYVDIAKLAPIEEWTSRVQAAQMLHCTLVALPALLGLVTNQLSSHIRKVSGTSFEVKTDIVELASLKNISGAPRDWVSDAQIRAKLKFMSLRPPHSIQIPDKLWVVAKTADSKTVDIFYAPETSVAIIKAAHEQR